ncbi:MAG: helix-hairpin-helix domain-containing protein [Paludibacteraceae bacterium]|nr:helix-hairpin-helix domain-containing protein [Paludibacteraceae bacterium]
MAQEKAWEDYFHDIYALEEIDDESIENDYEHLCELESTPLNINTLNPEDLYLIPGLNRNQIDEIIKYRDRHGEFRTIEELALIESIDRPLRLFLCNFIIAAPITKNAWYSRPTLDSIMRKGHGEIQTSTNIPLYNRQGDKNGYLGYKYKYNLKISGKFSDNIKYGFCGSQDAGEPLFANKNKLGMDYYSFYIKIGNIKRLKTLVIGQYNIKLGMGLIQNNSFGYGKQMMLSSMNNYDATITGHATRSDGGYFQGIANTIDIGKSDSQSKWTLTTFWSYRNIDATLNKDGSISTIITSGYHRTPTEMEKKNNSSTTSLGAHINYKRNGIHMGISTAYNWFNRDLTPNPSNNPKSYRTYYAQGNNFWNISINYGYISRKFVLSGETATGSCNSIATINAAEVNLNKRISLYAVQRFYSYKYYAINAKSFNDGGYTQNESGIYGGAKWTISPRITLDAYSDLAYYPWIKYYCSTSSYSFDNNISLKYEKNDWILKAKYKFKIKQRNNSEKTFLQNRYSNKLRMSIQKNSEKTSFTTNIDFTELSFTDNKSIGYSFSQNASIELHKKTSIYIFASYFHTDDSNSSIYVTERNNPGVFNSSSYYGEGVRFSSSLKAMLTSKVIVNFKFALTSYFNRNVISSGLRMINSSYQTDIDLNVKYKF